MSDLDNGYRVVWDLGWWLDCEDFAEAHDLYCALQARPAFQDELRRPRVFPIKDGVLQALCLEPWESA